MAAKIDPMHQFVIQPIAGSFEGSNPFVFTNSALWMLIVLGTIYVFMLGGMKRELIPGRWQVAVEGLTGFVSSMVTSSIGPEGKKYMPWIFTAFVFILFANLMGTMPFGVIPGAHPFTVTSQFTDHRRHVADQFRDRAGRRLLTSMACISSRCSGRKARRSC